MMGMPKPLDLDAIRVRVKAATVGPWKARVGRTSSGIYCDGIASERGDIVRTDSGFYPPRVEDAEFIAHARTDVPALLDEVGRLREQAAKLREILEPGARESLIEAAYRTVATAGE